jgi:hypothetical protein
VPEPSISEVEVAVGKMQSYKLPGVDQILAELFQVWWWGEHCILRFVNLLGYSLTMKNCLTSGKSRLSYLYTKRV